MIHSELTRYRRTTIAVTRATGFIASALIEALRDSDATVIAVSRSAAPRGATIEWLQCDVQTADGCSAIAGRADVIFHLAGNTSARAAEKDGAASSLQPWLPSIIWLPQLAPRAVVRASCLLRPPRSTD